MKTVCHVWHVTNRTMMNITCSWQHSVNTQIYICMNLREDQITWTKKMSYTYNTLFSYLLWTMSLDHQRTGTGPRSYKKEKTVLKNNKNNYVDEQCPLQQMLKCMNEINICTVQEFWISFINITSAWNKYCKYHT